ncbi:MAG: CxxC-x17-CxxC domain-containing protein [Parcubacteria group bacterium]
MGDFNKRGKFGGRRGGGRSYGGGRDDGRDGGRPTMHKAVCNDCGNDCEVPFRPTGSKPVFCSDCFGKKDNNKSRDFQDRGNRRYGSNDRDSRPRFDDRRSSQGTGGTAPNLKAELEQINITLNKILKVLTPAEAEYSQKIEQSKPLKKEVDTIAVSKLVAKAIGKKTTKKTTTKKKKK